MNKTETEGKNVVELLGNILLGGGIALAVCCVFLFFAALAISTGWLSETTIHQLTVTGCILGTASGALFAIRRSRSRTLLIGLAVAVVFVLLLLTVGILVFEGMSVEQGGFSLILGSLCGGSAVGLIGGKKTKKRRKK